MGSGCRLSAREVAGGVRRPATSGREDGLLVWGENAGDLGERDDRTR